MLKHKKIAAAVMSLSLSLSVAFPYMATVYAENESGAESSAAEEENDYKVSGDYAYSLTELGTVCIESYTGTDDELVIPESIDGTEVTRVNKYALESCTASSIHFPASITYISGENPFIQCMNLKKITVDEKNEKYTAEDGILYSKDKRELLCYPPGRTDETFAVPDFVEEIGIAAFAQSSLKEITFPASVSVINRHAVSSCESLRSADLSNTAITSVDTMAFSYCTSLTELKLPDSLVDIGDAAFAGCSALGEVTLPESLISVGQNAFAGTALTEITIPASVNEISYCAFGYDEELNPVEDFVIIGEANSAAQIYATDSDEEYEYANNFTFKTTTQAENELEELDSQSFGDFEYAEVDGEAYITACYSMENTIEVPDEINGLPVTCIYGGAFFQNGASSIILPESLKKIEMLAFCMCSNLTSITIPDGVESIGESAFASCYSLETVVIPGTCQSLGKDAFYDSSSIKEFSVSDAEGGSYSAENGVLYNKDKTVLAAYPTGKTDKSFKLPSSVEEISDSAFCGCTSLEKVDISSASGIGDYAFEDCTNLKSVKFSDSIDSIGICAFYGCPSLKSVRLGEVGSIDAYALGFVYDTKESTDKLIDGFKIYADEGSGGYNYAKLCEIECVSDTYEIFGLNVVKGFIYGVAALVGAAILAVIGIFTGKAVKRKKAEKADGGKEKKDEA